MSNCKLNFAALEKCLQTLEHLFIDRSRLVAETRYEEKRGGYGTVQVSTLDPGTRNSKLVAAKRISLRARNKDPRRAAFRLARELKVWAGLHHPHILPVLGYYLDEGYRIAILMSEYMIYGDLRDYIDQTTPSWASRLNLARDLTDGLAYLHGQEPPVLHGDLKPGNVLVNAERRALLADFGLSKALEELPTGLSTSEGLKGTLRYYSPELLIETNAKKTLLSDIWAWACLVLEVLADKIPYDEKKLEPQVMLALAQKKPPSNAETLPIPAPAIKRLLAQCWSIQPHERPLAKDCLHILNSETFDTDPNDVTDSSRLQSIATSQSSQPGFQSPSGARQAGAQSSSTSRYADASPLNDAKPISSSRNSPAMDTPRPTTPSNNLPSGEPTITRRKMRNSGLWVFNPGNNSDGNAVLIPRNVTPQTTTQLLPKPLPVPGVAQGSYFPQQIPLQQLQSPHIARPAQRQPSHPIHSASSSTSSISIPASLSSQPVFQFPNGARQAGAQSSPTSRYANASPLNYVGSSSIPRSSPAMDTTTPPTTPSNNLPPLSFAGGVTDGRNWDELGLDVAAEVDYPAPSSSTQPRPDARNGLYVDHAKSISQSQPAVNPGPTPTLMKPDRREPVDKLIITVTADAKNHVIVDITNAKDAAFIRERMFSRLRIPDDDYDNYQIYRTELGEAEHGDPITGDQLMIYCEAWADAKGTLKFLVQRNFATPPSSMTPLVGIPSRRPHPAQFITVAAAGAYLNPNTPASHRRRESETAAMEREQGFEAAERYRGAQNKEFDSQYNKARAEKDRQNKRQHQHGSEGSAPSGHKANRSESVNSSVPHGWVMVNEVFPTPTSATGQERFQNMGQRTPSYGRSNTTGAVNEWTGSPPSDGPRFSPASATTPSASRPYPHATNTSYTATTPTLQRSQAVKYSNSHPHQHPYPRTENRGHALLPPGAVDPRMRQIEWQQEPTASPAQFYSPSIAPSYPPPAAHNDPQQSTPPSSGSARSPGAPEDYGNGLPKSLGNGASLFSGGVFTDGPPNRNPGLRPKPSTDRMNVLDRTMAAHAQPQSRDHTPSLQSPPLPTPSASSSFRVGWMSNSTSLAPSRPNSGDVDSGDLNRPSRIEKNATNVLSMLETRRPVITAKATPISLRNAHAKSILREPSQSNAGEVAQSNGAEGEEEEYYDSDSSYSEEDERFWNNGSAQSTTATSPAIKTSGPDNEENSTLGPFNRTKGLNLWVTIPPLVDDRGSPMPAPSAAATNLPTSTENLPSISPGLIPTSGINRRASFRRDTWAFRPIQEDVLDHLQDFFPDHDLDKQFIDQVRITNEGLPSPRGEALPPPVPAPVSKEAKFKHWDRIRFVAEERKKVMERVGSAREPSAKAEKLGRKGSTKLWGSRVEEVTPGQPKRGVPPTIPESPTRPAPRPTIKWVKGELIVEGTYSKVFLAFNVTTGEMMAVKQVKMPQTISDQDDVRQVSVVKALESEQRTLEKLDHQNIVQYLGFEKTKEFFSVFLEYVPGGTIGSCLGRHGKFEENIIKSFTGQIVDGLAYLHANKIIHRDIKADSVLVDPSGNCKISDFGISKQSEEIYNNAAMTPLQGSLFWMAPEVIHSDKKGYNAKIDIWSLGCVFIEMFAGRRPWEQDDFVSVMFKVGRNKTAPPVPSDVHLSEEADDFRLKCFAQDPDERPTAEGLKGHPWLDLPPGWIFSDFR